MKENFQKIDDVIQVLHIVISEDRCLCSDSEKERLNYCIVLLHQSKTQDEKGYQINWELVFTALEIATGLFVNAVEIYKHLL